VRSGVRESLYVTVRRACINGLFYGQAFFSCVSWGNISFFIFPKVFLGPGYACYTTPG
jgi:hypothetical protein